MKYFINQIIKIFAVELFIMIVWDKLKHLDMNLCSFFLFDLDGKV